VPVHAHNLDVLNRLGRAVQDKSVRDLGGEAAGRALHQGFGGNVDLVVAHRVCPHITRFVFIALYERERDPVREIRGNLIAVLLVLRLRVLGGWPPPK
jgi:hypothetical protein